MSLTVFLTDDRAVVREGLNLWLETQADHRAAGEATHGNLAALRRSGTATRRNLNTGFYEYAHAINRPPHPNPLPPKRGERG